MDRATLKRTVAVSAALLVVAVSVWLIMRNLGWGGHRTTPAPPVPIPRESAQTAAIVEIEVSNRPPRTSDGQFTFRVIADDHIPETGQPSLLQVNTIPYLPLRTDTPIETPIAGRKEWVYTAQVTGDDINLVKIRASICGSHNCTGKLDKTTERIVDVGSTNFDDYVVVIHPSQLVAGRYEPEAFIDIQREGHVVTPTSTVKLHVAARDGCVQFQPENKETEIASGIDLFIDAAKKKSQTEYFAIQPSNLPPDNCQIDVAAYDDEKQRPTPSAPQVSFRTNPWTAIWMSLSGSAVALLFVIWRRYRRGDRPMFGWSDPFEHLAKGFLAVLAGLVLTKTDFIGITIDKSSANGFFTTGFFLGFVPLDTVFDRILKYLGITPPDARPTAQAPPTEDIKKDPLDTAPETIPPQNNGSAAEMPARPPDTAE